LNGLQSSGGARGSFERPVMLLRAIAILIHSRRIAAARAPNAPLDTPSTLTCGFIEIRHKVMRCPAPTLPMRSDLDCGPTALEFGLDASGLSVYEMPHLDSLVPVLLGMQDSSSDASTATWGSSKQEK